MPAPSVYEFRNYVMRPGRRDVLIDLFECEFIESQEAGGSRVVATFRNLDDPNRFVWMRAFADMQARAAALDAFYTSPLWLARRNEANTTMVDSDDVLLLRPVAGSALRNGRAPIGATETAGSVIVATTYFLHPNAEGDFAAFFARDVAPALDATPFATFATEHSPNSYPRLPVRENERVFLTLTHYESASALAAAAPVAAKVTQAIARHIVRPTETLRLQPSARSALR